MPPEVLFLYLSLELPVFHVKYKCFLWVWLIQNEWSLACVILWYNFKILNTSVPLWCHVVSLGPAPDLYRINTLILVSPPWLLCIPHRLTGFGSVRYEHDIVTLCMRRIKDRWIKVFLFWWDRRAQIMESKHLKAVQCCRSSLSCLLVKLCFIFPEHTRCSPTLSIKMNYRQTYRNNKLVWIFYCLHVPCCLVEGIHKNHSTSLHQIWWRCVVNNPWNPKSEPQCVTPTVSALLHSAPVHKVTHSLWVHIYAVCHF